VHADVEAAWQNVVDGWEDPGRHEQLMGVVAQHGAFAWAAARYKERAGDAVADKQLERIRKAAMATMLASASKKPEAQAPYKRTMIIFMVLIVMLLIGFLGVKMMHDTRRGTPHPGVPPRGTPGVTQPASH